MMRSTHCIFVLVFWMALPTVVYSQEILKTVSPIGKDLIDTLFIDNDVDNWSMRVFGGYKDNQLILSNSGMDLKFIPNNRFVTGVGYANSKIHLDVGFAIKDKDKEQTDRFTFNADLTLYNSLIGIRIARYKGYEVNGDDIPDYFREDITTFGVDLFYGFLNNSKRVSVSSVLSGSTKQIKGAGSFLGGGFLYYHQLNADSSIISGDFSVNNPMAGFRSLVSFAIGITGGYAYSLVFARNFFFSIAAFPGMGINFKTIKTEDSEYNPDDLLTILFMSRTSIGYNSSKYYIELSHKFNFNRSDFGFGNRGSLNATEIKLAVGFKLWQK